MASSVYQASLRLAVVTEKKLTANQADRMLAFLQKDIDGLTYNIQQKIKAWATGENVGFKEVQGAFGGRMS